MGGSFQEEGRRSGKFGVPARASPQPVSDRSSTTLGDRRPGPPHLPTSARVKPVTALAAGVYTLAGANHFRNPRFYERIMPPYLPAHRELVAASGVAEIAGGVGLLAGRTRRPAGWWLIATLLGVFPANVHMALNPDDYGWVPGGRKALYARLPVQALFIWLVVAAMRD